MIDDVTDVQTYVNSDISLHSILTECNFTIGITSARTYYIVNHIDLRKTFSWKLVFDSYEDNRTEKGPNL